MGWKDSLEVSLYQVSTDKNQKVLNHRFIQVGPLAQSEGLRKPSGWVVLVGKEHPHSWISCPLDFWWFVGQHMLKRTCKIQGVCVCVSVLKGGP